MVFNWTLNKIIPYILTFIGGVFLSYIISKSKRKIRFTRFFIWVIPFGIYFVLYPIYEGDFSNNYREVSLEKGLVTSNENQFIVITIPNCPFCMASIQTIKEIKQRVPNMKIKYIVCSRDKSSVNLYKQQINGFFPISSTKNPMKWSKVCQGKFPCYVLITKSNIRIWSNDNFGTLAKDEIENYFLNEKK